jgi:hypothetical protein
MKLLPALLLPAGASGWASFGCQGRGDPSVEETAAQRRIN